MEEGCDVPAKREFLGSAKQPGETACRNGLVRSASNQREASANACRIATAPCLNRGSLPLPHFGD